MLGARRTKTGVVSVVVTLGILAVLHGLHPVAISVLGGEKTFNALPWATPCVLGLMYGHSPVELTMSTGEATFIEYTYTRAMQCIRESNAKILEEECDVEAHMPCDVK